VNSQGPCQDQGHPHEAKETISIWTSRPMLGSWTQTWSYKNQEQNHLKLDFLNVQFAAAHCDFLPYFDDLCIAKLAKHAPHINYWLTDWLPRHSPSQHWCQADTEDLSPQAAAAGPECWVSPPHCLLHSATPDTQPWLTDWLPRHSPSQHWCQADNEDLWFQAAAAGPECWVFQPHCLLHSTTPDTQPQLITTIKITTQQQ